MRQRTFLALCQLLARFVDEPQAPLAMLSHPVVIFSLHGMHFEWMPELKWRG